MHTRHTEEGTHRGVASRAALDRWILVPVVVGVVFAGVQTVHVFRMFAYGPLGVVLEAVVPLVLAVALGATGPWLHRKGYSRPERRRVVGWMAVVATLVGLLFGWALSHQLVLGYPFRHAPFVATTNLIAGSLLGLFVGVYDVRSRRHRRAIEVERETVAQQRSRLSVLNRVLRHNIRNEAAVVIGLTEGLADRTSGETAEMAAAAAAKTGDLVALGDKARRIERATDVDAGSVGPVDLHHTVAAAVEDAERRGEGANITVDVPARLRVTAAEEMLFRVLEELLGNALDHADAAPLSVRVSARPTDGGDVEVTVEDDGSGIPAHELESLRSGAETALEHGSGLGLWLVKWGVATLGGELAFGESEWGGAAVRVTLPGDGSPSG